MEGKSMRFGTIQKPGKRGVALCKADGTVKALFEGDEKFPGMLDDLVANGSDALRAAGQVLESSPVLACESFEFLPTISKPGKILCIGLNYADHSAEGGFEVPDYPTVFVRFSTGLIGHEQSLILPRVSDKFDYEGELVAVIGKTGRNIQRDDALDHVIGYSIFNDGSLRDFQMRTPQWTVGKNFDGTGAFGPWLVTSDELPEGCKGLKLETRLNGEVVQSASTDDLVFSVADLISILSEVMTLEAGDIIVTGTPAGVGAARKPPLWMKAGDVCEIEVEGVGKLSNTVVAE